MYNVYDLQELEYFVFIYYFWSWHVTYVKAEADNMFELR